MSWMQEFRTFAMKGSMVDLAIGVIIGTVFGKVISSLVSDIIMPPLGYLIGGVDFSSLSIPLGKKGDQVIEIKYGLFLNTVIDFLIIACVIFMVIKLMNRLKGDSPAAPTTCDCPECLMTIPIKAKKCGHCGSTIKPGS